MSASDNPPVVPAPATAAAAAAGPNTAHVAELNDLIKQWETNYQQSGWDPTPVLRSIADIVEDETENYLKADPDPFDERHPTRVNPLCTLGQLFKIICKKDTFMDKLVLDYTKENYWQRSMGNATRDVTELNTQAARLLFDIMPGLETSVVFQEADALVRRLFSWAGGNGSEPLRSYATALLSSAMEIQDLAANFRESNVQLVPVVMRRLKTLQDQYLGVADSSRSSAAESVVSDRPFASVGNTSGPAGKPSAASMVASVLMSPPRSVNTNAENSNSSWAELGPQVIATFQVYPMTPVTQQILLLRYLIPLGEYQEWLSQVLENRMIDVIFRYIDFRLNNHSRLAFEALRYLSALLCHKKFTLDFLNGGGLEALLSVPRPGVAATGVSMCLYYLAYSEDAMERVCQFPEVVISRLVKYALWLLECSHESGRCHATMCFGLSFQFRPILLQFDRQDGMRKLLNVVSTLRMLTSGSVDTLEENDDQFTARQTMRHVCFTIKCYMEAQLVLKAEQVKRNMDGHRGAHTSSSASHLCLNVTPESVGEALDLFTTVVPYRARWKPVNTLLKLGGLKTLLQIIEVSQEINFSGKCETICSALDAINICCVLPVSQLQLCERLTFPGGRNVVGIALVIAMAETDLGAAEVQKSALRIIINCVSRPLHRTAPSPLLETPASASRRWAEDLLPLMWDAVRNNNGIMALMSLIQIKTPITDADAIRALACRALVGLARSDSAKQIMSKLPLFVSSQLQMTIREPILQEKRAEHVQLQRDSLVLLEQVSGRSRRHNTADTDITLDTIHRANVVAQTRIHYNEQQLLYLMHSHLMAKGLQHSAAALKDEANLVAAPSVTNHCATPMSNRITNGGVTPGRPPPPRPTAIRPFSPVDPLAASPLTLPVSRQVTSSSSHITVSRPGGVVASGTQLGRTVSMGAAEGTSVHLRTLGRSGGTRSDVTLSPASVRATRLKSAIAASDPSSPAVGSVGCSGGGGGSNSTDVVSLDRIVTEYLMNQHALCRNPMVTCPQFDLLEPHRCPEPRSRRQVPANLACRVAGRSTFPPHGGPGGARHDTRFLYSRYCPVRTFRDVSGDDTTLFTSATFTPDDMKYMMVGAQDGTVRAFNLESGEVEETYNSLHSSSITNLQVNATGSLMLTSSRRRRPLSALWSIENVFENKFNFADDEYVEFGGASCDRVLGTQRVTGTLNFHANIYDISTGQRISQLSPRIGNGYSSNRATFDPSGDLVLNNGVLFDVRSPRELHKFDKFNNTISGVFHPNGVEIVANTEVWDLRSFHLLRTVPALQQCRLRFANTAPVVFGVRVGGSDRGDDHTSEDVTAFRVVDAGDYSSIATVDVRRHVYGLCVSRDDRQLAVVESQLDTADTELEQACVRLYDIGRVRGADDVDDQDEEDAENVDDSDGSEGSDTMANDIANALFGFRPRRRRGAIPGGDDDDEDAADDSDDGSDFSFVLSGSGSSYNAPDFADVDGDFADASNSDNSWVTEDEQMDDSNDNDV